MHQINLAHLATHRNYSLFFEDLETHRPILQDRLRGSRILVIGGAGSIGSATLEQIVQFSPAVLHVIDQNENELAELVRALRSAPRSLPVDDFRALPLDYGSAAFSAFMLSGQGYDFVLNFAAIKHVRSEKDGFSIMQMLDTNIRKQARLMKLLEQIKFSGRYFSVSTDKAANPTSMMGASKRVMEHVMFDSATAPGLKCTITSARFANVAFSNGSLLQAFVHRLAKHQPLAVPEATRRYFVSMEEAGQLCLLAAITAPHSHILIPRLDPETSLIELQTIAERFIRGHGLEPAIYRDEDAAREAVANEAARGHWPLLLTKLSTSGEKPYEEFVGSSETEVELGYQALLAVPYVALADTSIISDMLERIEDVFRSAEIRAPSKEVFKEIIAMAEPSFLESHRETGQTLDERV